MKATLARTLVMILISFTVASGVAEQGYAGKHPRVAELESVLTKDAAAYLKGRFPETPFLVQVNIDPLHRNERAAKSKEKERLPYYEVDNQEIQDEWDDPDQLGQALLARVRKVNVTVSASNVNEEEVAEIRASLLQSLGLTPARDEVVVQKRAWKTGPDYRFYGLAALAAALVALVMILAGLYVIARGSVGKLVTVVQQFQAAGAKPVAPPAAPVAMNMNSEKAKNNGPEDPKFSDPIKVREAVSRGIKALIEKPSFPALNDMIILDRFGSQDPASLGALVLEFPADLQKRLFAYSFGDYWLDALVEPGELNAESVNLLRTLTRQARGEDAAWQSLLLNVWRLGGERARFFESVGREEALAVLTSLPKAIALSAAREAFPDDWTAVLDPSFKAAKMTAEQIEKMNMTAMRIKPHRDFQMLERYRRDKDLLDYLKTIEPSEEREIYGASPSHSVIHALRAPFFKVLDLDQKNLAMVASRVSIDDWALALVNIAETERMQIEKCFTDKQRFVLLEKLKAHDADPPAKRSVGDARERIAQLVDRTLSQNTPAENDQQQEAEGAENKAA